jgi:aspartokinase/homoserine dehydrogenase 1
MNRLEIHKFGGTSVAGADRLRAVASLMADVRQRTNLVIVSSATAGTTDQLLELGRVASQGEVARVRELAQAIEERHLRILAELGGDDDQAVEPELTELVRVARQLAEAVAIHGELTRRVRDRMVIVGEKLAVRLFALALRRQGIAAEACDADGFLETDGHFGEANALAGVADRTTRAALQRVLDDGTIPVVTGFCGRAPDGATTTLGRGGSDLSATLIASAMEADEVTIWTDVDGVFSADPRAVPDARVIRQLNYREAAEMSFYGAKVLHQRTMIPVVTKGIPVWTRNSLNPDALGTVVDGRFTPGSFPVKAVSAIRGQALLSLEGKGMAGVAGISARLFSALAREGISVTMISQSSSEASICVSLRQEEVQVAERVVKQEFRPELSRGEVEEVALRRQVGLVAVVGLGMAQQAGVAGRAMEALGREKINIFAIAQGPAELNITVAVDEVAVDPAVRTLHKAFGLHRIDTGAERPDGLDLMVLGTGNIGCALIKLLLERHEHLRQRFGLRARVVALADRSGYLLEPAGFAPDRLLEILAAKESGQSLGLQTGGRPGPATEMVQEAMRYRLTRPILVDTSDAADGHLVFSEAFQRGCDVVTANKKPLSAEVETFERILTDARRSQRVLRAEATVGAGLPVIDTLDILQGAGQSLLSAEGSLSGTLGFVMSRLQEGQPLSEAVSEAYNLGYTEPDPVADLAGTDVARKAIILGRLSGLVSDENKVKLQGLVDPDWAGIPLEEFWKRLRQLDEEFAQRVNRARDQGKALRYLARVGPGAIEVGPVEAELDSPAGRLSGTENLIVFRTEQYDAVPLVITGPGAGVEVTAMGVLGDIMRIAAERGGA